MNVSEVRVGVLDAAGAPIEAVYVKNDPHYAIYRTSQRVMIHFADDGEEKKEQQRILATLNPLRNEINALIDGWRTSSEHDKEAMTRLYDRRIADALALALENDPTSAQALLKGTLDEIAEERQSRGRVEHLILAALTTVAVAVLVILATWIWDADTPNFLDHNVNALLFAAAIGAVGALVSIGIAVRERQLTTDLQTRDNVADAVLRVTVGAVGAVLLIAMLRADLIDVDIGNVDLAHRQEAQDDSSGPGQADPTEVRVSAPETPPATPDTNTVAGAGEPPSPPSGGGAGPARPGGSDSPSSSPVTVPAGDNSSSGETNVSADEAEVAADRREMGLRGRTTELLVILVIAFFAGFSERLVKQLAERMQFRDVAADLTPAGAAPGPGAPGQPNRLAGPGGGDESSEAPDAGGDADDDDDGCLAHHEVEEDDATDDTQLPPASGGVEDAPKPIA